LVDLAEAPPVVVTTVMPDAERTGARLRMAAICMIGVALGTTILPFAAVDAVRGPMMLELGWSADQLRISYSLMLWAGAICAWPIGVLTDRFGPRRAVAAAAVAIALVSLLLPFVGHVWQFNLLFALLGVCSSVGLAYSKVVASLFDQHRGLAFGIFAAAGSALSMTLPQATQQLVHDGGWRGAFSLLGLAALALAPVLYFGLARSEARAPGAHAAGPDSKGLKASDAARSRAFWQIVVAGLLCALVSGFVMNAFVAAMPHRGLGEIGDLRKMPIGVMAYLAGPICAGFLLDRTKSPLVAVAAVIGSATTSMIWGVVSSSFGGQPLLIASYALGAFAASAQLPVAGYLLTRYFGLKSFATIFSLQTFIQSVVIGVCSPLIALWVAPSGDAPLTFAAGALAPLTAAALYLLLPAYRFGAPREPGLAAQPSGRAGRFFKTWWPGAPS
jgi:MFS family permease